MRKRQVLVNFLIAISCLFGMCVVASTHTQAEVEGPDWINAQPSFELADYTASTQDASTVIQNIPQQYVTAQWNTGSFGQPKLMNQDRLVSPTSSGYFSLDYVLPLGETRWQRLDPGEFYKTAFFPNPGDTGVLAQLYYNESNISADKKVTRYILDWRSTFNKLSADSAGNLTRTLPALYDMQATTTVLKNPDGSSMQTAKTISPSFSKNGEWAYIRTSLGELRVHIPDLKYKVVALPISSPFALYSAVSNTGRFVAAANSVAPLYVYDTARCSSDLAGDCQKSQDLTRYAKGEFSKTLTGGKSVELFNIRGIKFVSESKLELYVEIKYTNGVVEYKKMYVGVNPGPQTTRYLALGDSFSSGEGAGDYYDTTNFFVDKQNFNKCHLSKNAYSTILAKTLAPDLYGSVACSGALIKSLSDIGDIVEYYEKYSQAKFPVLGDLPEEREAYIKHKINSFNNSFIPGYASQTSFIKLASSSVSTITLGGNDIGFSDIVISCVLSTNCYASRDDREKLADMIDTKIIHLEQLYRSLLSNMSGNAPKLYVVGYPHLFNDTNACASYMASSEREFANRLVDYINQAIRIAATRAGAVYVNVSDVFINANLEQDYRLCGGSALAANGLTLDFQNKSDGQPLELLFASSYHPNKLGHQLLAERIKALSNNFSRPMPASSLSEVKPPSQYYKSLVGDTADNVKDITSLDTILAQEKVVVGSGQTVSIDYVLGEENGSPAAGQVVTVVVQSTPQTIGSLVVQPGGLVQGSLVLPVNLEPGVHTLHLKYKDISGRQRDVMQHFYLFASNNDFDGDGILNQNEMCVLGGTLGMDYDKDGVDDSCDGDLSTVKNSSDEHSSSAAPSQPKPSMETQPAVTSVVPRAQQAEGNGTLGASQTRETDATERFGVAYKKTPNAPSVEERDSQPSGNNWTLLYLLASILTLLVTVIIFTKRKSLKNQV